MINRVLVLQALTDVANICYNSDKKSDNFALSIITTYMELQIKLSNIYLLSCNNINFNDNHIVEKDVLIIEPVVGQEIEIPFEHIISCSVIDL